MTEQYTQRNINQQGSGVVFTAAVGAADTTLQPSVQLAQIDTTAVGSTVTLPFAGDAGQNATITVVKTVAANTVTIAAGAGDTLVAAAGIVNPLVAIWQTLTVKADPVRDRWVVTGQTV